MLKKGNVHWSDFMTTFYWHWPHYFSFIIVHPEFAKITTLLITYAALLCCFFCVCFFLTNYLWILTIWSKPSSMDPDFTRSQLFEHLRRLTCAWAQRNWSFLWSSRLCHCNLAIQQGELVCFLNLSGWPWSVCQAYWCWAQGSTSYISWHKLLFNKKFLIEKSTIGDEEVRVYSWVWWQCGNFI